MEEEDFDDRALEEWLEDYRTRIEALENGLTESQSLKNALDTLKKEVFQRLESLDASMEGKTKTLKASIAELSNIVSRPNVPMPGTEGTPEPPLEGGEDDWPEELIETYVQAFTRGYREFFKEDLERMRAAPKGPCLDCLEGTPHGPFPRRAAG